MKFSELITKLHSASQPHMLMYIDIRSNCELADVNILASGQSDVQAGTLYFADAGQQHSHTAMSVNLRLAKETHLCVRLFQYLI